MESGLLDPVRAGLRRFRSWLPKGDSLPEAAWRSRHRVILGIVAAHVPFIFVFAIARGYGAAHGLVETLPVALPALAAAHPSLGRTTRAMASTFGLVSASAVLVHLSGGSIETHFHFFVAVMIIALYESWVTFGLAIAYVVVHHGLMGTIAPHDVFNHPAAFRHPWLWAGLHGLFIAMESVAAVVFWRFNEVARARLSESEARHRTIVEMIQEGLWIVDERGRTTFANPAAAAMAGVEAAAMVGRAPLEFVHPDDRPDAQRRIAAGIAGSGEAFDVRFRRPDGSEPWALVHLAPMPPVDGRPAGALASLVDITERKLLEEEARRLDEARTSFISDASHELRTPLTVLSGMTRMLADERGALTAEETDGVIDALDRQGTRMIDLVNSLLDLSRLEAAPKLHPRPVDLSTPIRMALAAAPPAAGHSVDVRGTEGIRALADPESLERALVNLLTNAYKYGGPGVSITSSTENGHAVITVQDDGPGVPPDLVPRLFEPFTRGRQTAGIQGSGLGMAIVKRLVEGCGGEITYEAADPRGARFLLRLPVAA